jgi:hypothetical protein
MENIPELIDSSRSLRILQEEFVDFKNELSKKLG